MDQDEFDELLRNETRMAYFDIIRKDLVKDPPDTENIRIIIDQLIDALCKFVPSKVEIHKKIKADIYQENITSTTMPNIVYGLINWIEQFQSPADDKVTNLWKDDFQNTPNYVEYIVKFLEEYYDHSEKVYREVWEARKRFVSGESVVPPEHRPKVEGNNGIPTNIRTGRK